MIAGKDDEARGPRVKKGIEPRGSQKQRRWVMLGSSFILLSAMFQKGFRGLIYNIFESKK